MVIEGLDRIGQKVAKRTEADFVIKLADEERDIEPPRVLEVGEYSVNGATAIADITQMRFLQYYAWKGSPTSTSLEVIWERKEEIPAVSTKFSEKELLDSWDRYLEEHWDELAAEYKRKYVAIWEDAVYDSDEDLAALAERVYAALGYQAIFMPYISEKQQVHEFISVQITVKPDIIIESHYHEKDSEPCPALYIDLTRPTETDPFQTDLLAYLDTGAPWIAVPIEHKAKGGLHPFDFRDILIGNQLREKEPIYLVKVLIDGYVSQPAEMIFWDYNRDYAIIGRNLMRHWHTTLKGPEQILEISEP